MTWWAIDETHDPALTSWVASARGHADFPIQNLPLGIYSTASGGPRVGTAIGDQILDLAACAGTGLLPSIPAELLRTDALNPLLASGPAMRRELRRQVSAILSDERFRAAAARLLHDAAACTLHLPARIGDYTDFYAGIHHAEGVGRQFRPDNPLLPNYKYVPIGYHGRASSVRPSGVPLVRPHGQRKPAGAEPPPFGPCTRLDYELELGIWIGTSNPLGTPIPIAEAAEHIAGLCLLNDWSARDVQTWEYQPLGPFLAKSFHTTISPWLITQEALAPFRIAQPPRPDGDPQPLAYLDDGDDQAHGAFALTLDVLVQTAKMRADGLPPQRLGRARASSLYWTVQQIVAHHASNGCDLRPGDLLGSGTISEASPDGLGSLLELTGGGQASVALPGGENRTFLEDGDEVIMRASAAADGFVPIGFGECRATVLPAL